MKNALFSLVFLAPHLWASNAPIPYQWGVYKPSPLGGNKIIIVDWNSPEGLKRLARSKHNQDFYQMAHAYQPQINPVLATAASAVVVLNAMRLPQHNIPSQDGIEIAKPKALGGGIIPFPAYSQLTFLNAETDKIKDRKLILIQNATPENENDKSAFKPGFGLEELQKMLKQVYKTESVVTNASEDPKTGAAKFRETLKKVLTDRNTFIVSNFKGDLLGAATEGTVSPLAAYDAATDSVMILDVTGHKNPWYWVPVPALYAAMHTQYDDIWRGYIQIKN